MEQQCDLSIMLNNVFIIRIPSAAICLLVCIIGFYKYTAAVK